MTAKGTHIPIVSLQYRNLNYRRFEDPFSLDDLLELNRTDREDPEAERGVHHALIEDFSFVDISGLTTEDVKRYISRLRVGDNIPAAPDCNPIACVASNPGSFGMLRMYGTYAELYGLRDEKDFFVATSLREAVQWIGGRTSVDPQETDDVIRCFGKVFEVIH